MAESLIDVEILADGKVSVTTGEIGETVHLSADEMLMEIEETLGGVVDRKRREHPFWAKRSVGLHGKIIRTA